jgi:hypothetical protein
VRPAMLRRRRGPPERVAAARCAAPVNSSPYLSTCRVRQDCRASAVLLNRCRFVNAGCVQFKLFFVPGPVRPYPAGVWLSGSLPSLCSTGIGINACELHVLCFL